MGKFKRKTSATPANVSRSSRCKTTRRQRLAARAAAREAISTLVVDQYSVELVRSDFQMGISVPLN